ncbi:MAG: MBL fold metallo-hydrolase [Phycisphaerales bacterium]
MFMRMVYDEKLAQAAYLFGCQKTGEAIVFDPERDVDRYLALAKAEELRITAVAETHVHADFLSGARELAERVGARVYASGEGGADWTPRWLDGKTGGGSYEHRLLKDGDRFGIGAIEFTAIHTPGHTPEHVCFLVTDRGGGADTPMGVLTGDFVFVGDVGRPDLLESAAGHAGSARPAARDLFRSLRRFAALPEFIQVWPAHGAGSACGKALGAVPQSTVGYEKRFNPALREAGDERGFVDFVLAGQPEPPAYFARMKRQNRDGPAVLGAPPSPRSLSRSELASLDTRRVALIDTRSWKAFLAGHVPGSLYLPLNTSFTTDAGSFIRDDEDIVLIVEPPRADEAARALVRIGLDRVVGCFDPADLEPYRSGGGTLTPSAEIDPAAAHTRLRTGGAVALDVRRASEFVDGREPNAVNIAHTRLIAHNADLPRDRPIIVNCRSGGRSARAVAFLRRAGFDAINLAGGFTAWEQAGLPVEK